tara:strand:+ start:33 stop:293 length:261 start_codon:yes stop_codon:yes gene_type:complete
MRMRRSRRPTAALGKWWRRSTGRWDGARAASLPDETIAEQPAEDGSVDGQGNIKENIKVKELYPRKGNPNERNPIKGNRIRENLNG